MQLTRTTIAALLAALLLPAQASALSCLPPNPARELDTLLEKGLDILVVRGTATRLSASPQAGGPATGRYRIEGEGAGRLETGEMTLEPEIRATCAGPWCAKLPEDGTEAIFLVRRSSRTDEIIADPCGGGIYPLTDDERLPALSECLAKGRCPAEIIERMEYRP